METGGGNGVRRLNKAEHVTVLVSASGGARWTLKRA